MTTLQSFILLMVGEFEKVNEKFDKVDVRFDKMDRQYMELYGVDIYTALQERATILFILNPLIYPELSPLLGRLSSGAKKNPLQSIKARSSLLGINSHDT
ncbi:MAG: hypothetical protein LBJ12_09150 [Oscillospiraceae bacterium]|jgi:hypothetical protein|nr:hypothetical protein [Oscillospiraceae bacterium]